MTLLVLVVGLMLLPVLAAGALALFAARTARRVEAALPPLGRFIEVGEARIHYLDEGTGPAVVLIHGLGGQMRNFTHSLVRRLSGDFRVVVIERPGSGYSTRGQGASAALGEQADTVAGVMRALGLRNSVLVGHSLGGALSLAIALEHPELVSGLALIAPLTHVVDEPPAVFAGLAIASPFVRWLVAWTVAAPVAIRTRDALLSALFGPDPVHADFATAGGGMLGLRPSAFYETSSDLVAVNEDLPGLVERYGSLRIPIGILFGTGDRILDPSLHGEGMLALGADTTLDLIAGGHMLPITAPDRAAALVRDVVRRAAETLALPAA